MRDLIETALRKIVGQPAWAIGRAGWITWIQFGSSHSITDRRGTRTVGDHALHLSCAWQWFEDGQVYASDDAQLQNITRLLSHPLVCSGIDVADDGGLCITFSNGALLRMYTDICCDEYWRLFSPAHASPHIVVGPEGAALTA